MIVVNNASGGYDGTKKVNSVSFQAKKGKLTGIIGPNGSGKTTLVKMITGQLPCMEGSITIDGTAISDFSSKELAKIVAVLPQHGENSFDFSVQEVVALGRYPYYKGLLKRATSEDERVVRDVMNITGVAHLASQSIASLSGGERQRVLLAKALAQEPQLLLLDEPTNHLDLSYQVKLMDTLKERVQQHELTVVAILHDLNIASLYCDDILLLHEGKMMAHGTPSEMMQTQVLQDVYRTQLHVQGHPVEAKPLIALAPSTQQNVPNQHESVTMEQKGDHLCMQAPFLYKTLSSALIGEGFSWAHTFINRHVPKNYACSDAKQEFQDYIEQQRYSSDETVGMMTAAFIEDVGVASVNNVTAYVTAGVGNACDASRAWQQPTHAAPGTINMFLFIEGTLTDAAFLQAMMTATEAKSAALRDRGVRDEQAQTLATGTTTDCVSVAATQQGKTIHYAGTATALGKAIGKAVYEALTQSLAHYDQRVGTRS
ncbi:iron (III) dicitrate ABC transporter ATPase [Fictibacillus macauensis ZFHKF-1]|uniref:Iron (III) dicitrate ABC transporter ATPase n=1 Tax=Fictibacillus macauensis ZFHKF-1 TaxID=1196324 RepID=I8AMW9_9BACL|nr:heme ABC transporter ATP-binding protein [Fictibacillus macauensis]EIT87049.1 iron (III) dicitrate ABC transporter ATPase [Fictibacillus macauensis ZFHKF-1]